MNTPHPFLTCCTQTQFEFGKPNTRPVVHSLRVSDVAPAECATAGLCANGKVGLLWAGPVVSILWSEGIKSAHQTRRPLTCPRETYPLLLG